MIKTNKYIIAKKHKNKWIPAKECCPESKPYKCVEIYSLANAKNVLEDMKNGDIPGHSKNCRYKIMRICYCDTGITRK